MPVDVVVQDLGIVHVLQWEAAGFNELLRARRQWLPEEELGQTGDICIGELRPRHSAPSSTRLGTASERSRTTTCPRCWRRLYTTIVKTKPLFSMYGRRGQPPPVYLRIPSYLPTFLPITFPLPSCLHFHRPASLIFCLLVYSSAFLSSCLPSIFSSCLPSHLSANLSVYLPQPPTCPSQPVCACSPSRAPKDSERRWAVGSDLRRELRAEVHGRGVQLKH